MTPIIKRAVLPALALLFILSCTSHNVTPLEVMTFNIRYDNPDDGMFSWDSRKEMVYWLIEKYDPDIMGLQEALKGQMDNLESSLSEYAWSGAGREDGEDRGEYVPVFYRKNMFSLIGQGNFWLSERPDEPGSISWDAACTRMVSWIKLKETGTGNALFVFNTHFDHVGEEARMQSARILVDSISHIAGSDPVIITGDFNCEPGSDPLKALSELLADTREKAKIREDGAGTTYVGFPGDLFTGKIIDHIFVSSHFDVAEHEIITDNTGSFFPSDHLPVRVSLMLKK